RKTSPFLAFAILLITISVTDSTSTTFRACKKDPVTVSIAKLPKHIRGPQFAKSSAEIVKALPEYGRNNLTEIIQSTQFPAQSFPYPYSGFVATVVHSYNYHLNLIIRPDDVWAAIMTQFSFYVNKNAEQFRNKFVNFEGQKRLEITTVGSLRTVSYSWFVNAMTNEIHRNLVDPQVKNWILPNFSTTTHNDKVAVGVIFMATMKKYFTYGFSMMCGIPYVTLEGTVQDWENVLGRLEKLKEYELQPWYELLHPIISKFVDAKGGKVDKKFWRAIVDREAGSGYNYISGWITAFAVFDNEGNWQGGVREGRGKTPLQRWFQSNQTLTSSSGQKGSSSWLSNKKKWPQIDMDDISSGIVEVDVEINDNGVKHKSVMLAGHMASEVKEQNGLALKPALGWAIGLKQTSVAEDN
ncbi:hypothetical protein Ocin01_12546, partial [Orchesella cincta]